jgi:hypothetical protein
MMSFALDLGTLSFGMKKIVSIPITWPGIPCASCLSLLKSESMWPVSWDWQSGGNNCQDRFCHFAKPYQ